MKARIRGVWRLDDGRIGTENLVPGQRVYGEDLVHVKGREVRTWDPTRSKLGAYLLKGGGQDLPLGPESRVLYLGAANGTTPSHVSDIARSGLVWSVEFSPRSFRDLAAVSEPRKNLVPFLADAWRPEQYAKFVTPPDLLYQDIAQRQQAAIFARNLNRFEPREGLLMIKARSVDVAAPPRQVYEDVVREVEGTTSYEVTEVVDLGPFEKDHAAARFVRRV